MLGSDDFEPRTIGEIEGIFLFDHYPTANGLQAKAVDSEMLQRAIDILDDKDEKEDEDFNSLICWYAILVTYNEEHSRVFKYIRDMSIDEDGVLIFSYLAPAKSAKLDDFLDDPDFVFPPKTAEENDYEYFERLAALPQVETRMATVAAYGGWEGRGRFVYNKTTKEITDVLLVKEKVESNIKPLRRKT